MNEQQTAINFIARVYKCDEQAARELFAALTKEAWAVFACTMLAGKLADEGMTNNLPNLVAAIDGARRGLEKAGLEDASNLINQKINPDELGKGQEQIEVVVICENLPHKRLEHYLDITDVRTIPTHIHMDLLIEAAEVLSEREDFNYEANLTQMAVDMDNHQIEEDPERFELARLYLASVEKAPIEMGQSKDGLPRLLLKFNISEI